MLVWSQDEPELIDWLQRLRAAVGDDELRLVIWDTTGFDIPWELFTCRAARHRHAQRARSADSWRCRAALLFTRLRTRARHTPITPAEAGS